MAPSKPAGDSLKTASDSSPLIIKPGKKRASAEVVELETTSTRQATPPTAADILSRLKRARSSLSKLSHLLGDFLVDAPPFSLWSPSFPTQQKGG